VHSRIVCSGYGPLAIFSEGRGGGGCLALESRKDGQFLSASKSNSSLEFLCHRAEQHLLCGTRADLLGSVRLAVLLAASS
jgi:hypothetical protein